MSGLTDGEWKLVIRALYSFRADCRQYDWEQTDEDFDKTAATLKAVNTLLEKLGEPDSRRPSEK